MTAMGQLRPSDPPPAAAACPPRAESGQTGRTLATSALRLELGRSRRGESENHVAGPMKRSSSREPCLTLAQRFSRVSGTRHKVRVFKVRERREPFGLSLMPSRWLWRSGLVLALEKWNFRK